MSFLSKVFGRKKVSSVNSATNADIRSRILTELDRALEDVELIADPDDDAIIRFRGEEWKDAQIDVTNIAGNIRAYPEEDHEELVQRFVRGIVAANLQEKSLDLDLVLPVLRPTDYIEHIRAMGTELASTPILGSLHCVYMEDNPDAMRPVMDNELGETHVSDIHKRSLKNIKPWLGKLVQESHDSFYLYYVEDNPFLITGLTLVDEFWSHVEKTHGPDFLFILPRKDQMFVLSPEGENPKELAIRLNQVTWEDNFNLLSSEVYHRIDGEMVVLTGK